MTAVLRFNKLFHFKCLSEKQTNYHAIFKNFKAVQIRNGTAESCREEKLAPWARELSRSAGLCWWLCWI